ncbi:hypothetical protein TNCV_2291971 [Trichonephila clavipes]|uniref:Uncharacterized protein n=1 Tax=Trichonephila clavipes TaxID=2585209 RepID=A0A8X6RPB4_TRICX|nr:hypothetical protein TNCV_2291971 [Trichonephila clavipes]
MSKSLALKASQRIRDVWSDWASDYASTHHGAQQGEAARRSSDMRQARHLPQRWYWEPVLETAELITSRLTGAAHSCLPSTEKHGPKGTQQEPQTPLSPVRVAAHGKHAGQTQKPVLTLRNRKCSQLASVDKNNALREIKLRLSYLQGKSTTMSVIAHQTEKEWISANEKSRQRMSQTQAESAAKQHAARLEEAHLRAHLCQT